jgi:subfamily B ATP-binding cassette protein MsbA
MPCRAGETAHSIRTGAGISAAYAHLPHANLGVVVKTAAIGFEPDLPSAGTAREKETAVMARLLQQLLLPYRRTLALILAAMLLQTAMNLAGPWPLKIVLDNVVGNRPVPHWLAISVLSVLGSESKLRIAAAAGMLAVLIAVVSGIGFYVASYYTERVGQCLANDLRLKMYQHLQRLSLGYYNTHQVGSILSTMFNDVLTIQNFASASTLNMFTDSLTIVGMLGVMFWLHWDFALIALTVTPLLALFVWRISKAIRAATEEVRKTQSDMVSMLQQGLQAIEVVQAFERQDFEERQLHVAGRHMVLSWLKARRASALLTPVVGLAVALCTGVVLWRGSSLVLAGAMTIGALTVFLSYLARFFQPVQDLAMMTNNIAQVSVGFERIRAILDADYVVPERPKAIDPPPFRGEVAFEHVAFGYDAAVPVLRDIHFTIKPGQMAGIVGPTGSGKSTLISLIGRFYDPDTGHIKIDGVDICEYKVHGLRCQIGFVLQETVLFRGTVRDNIAFGRPNASHEDVVRAAKLANADEFISRMPQGYDSPISERGTSLSGGQRQRIGIARALIRDNPILVLDEPTAALDAGSEHLVTEALERLMEGRTVITITHRLSTIRDAHKIIVIDHGVVAEDGTHEELLARDGLYAELHRIQYEQEPRP